MVRFTNIFPLNTHTQTHIYLYTQPFYSLCFLIFSFTSSLTSTGKKKKSVMLIAQDIKILTMSTLAWQKKTRQLALSYPEVKLNEQDMENHAHDMRN